MSGTSPALTRSSAGRDRSCDMAPQATTSSSSQHQARASPGGVAGALCLGVSWVPPVTVARGHSAPDSILQPGGLQVWPSQVSPMRWDHCKVTARVWLLASLPVKGLRHVAYISSGIRGLTPVSCSLGPGAVQVSARRGVNSPVRSVPCGVGAPRALVWPRGPGWRTPDDTEYLTSGSVGPDAPPPRTRR